VLAALATNQVDGGEVAAMPPRAATPAPPSTSWSCWRFMSDNNPVIMAVVCLVLAAKLIGSAIGGLTD